MIKIILPNNEFWKSGFYNNTALMLSLENFKGRPIIDRTGKLDLGFPYHVVTPLPKMRLMEKSWTELMDQRAIEISELDVPFKVAYSGGIDSTSMMCSFLKTGTKFHATICPSAIDENPIFWEKFKDHPDITWIHYNKHIRPNIFLDPQQKVVDGALCESIVGRGVPVFGETDFDHVLEPWETWLDPESIKYQYLLPVIEECPWVIKTTFDLKAWLNMVLTHQYFEMRQYRSNPPIMKYGHIISFWNTEEFHLWGMNNPDKKIKDTHESYKWVLKDYILDYVGKGIQDYCQTKVNHPSMKHLKNEDFIKQHAQVALSENFIKGKI
jgi:hypothetical protein